LPEPHRAMLRITTLIPTYRRTHDLARCLTALKQQTRQAEEVLLIVRDSDSDTWEFLRSFSPQPLNLKITTVTLPGQVAALNAGLDTAQGDIIAITDDDAAPHPDWLARIEQHFIADPQVGGVGGRDWMYLDGVLQDASVHPGASQTIGRLQWSGRTIGNHHIGVGAFREVDILKGANMSFRRTAIAGLRFDENLKGTGAQVHNDLAFSLAVKRRGWKLIYDPAVAVDHYLAKRFDRDQRLQFDYKACCNAAHNETYIMLEHLPPPRAVVYLLWAFCVGTRTAFGLVQLIRFLPQQKGAAIQQWFASTEGRWQGCKTWYSRAEAKTTVGAVNSTHHRTIAPTTQQQISVVIITQDEEVRTINAIRSCKPFADEIIVVDGGSKDETVARSQTEGCTVYINPWPGYAKQRRFAIDQTHYDWILMIDSDEVVSPELAATINHWKTQPQESTQVFAVDRVGDFLGSWLTHNADDQLRLFNKQVFQVPDVPVHEGIITGDAPIIKLEGTLWHHGFRSIQDHVDRFNKYTDLDAQKAYSEGKRFNLLRLLLKPPARLAQSYFLQGLFRRGVPGLAVAIFKVYYDLLKEIKLYEIEHNPNPVTLSPSQFCHAEGAIVDESSQSLV